MSLHSHTVVSRSCPLVQGLLVDESTAAAVYERGNTAYRLAPHGLDAVDFLLAAGPAEPLRPLAAVASGGEAARIMLALKAAPAAAAASVAASAPGSDDAGELVCLLEAPSCECELLLAASSARDLASQ